MWMGRVNVVFIIIFLSYEELFFKESVGVIEWSFQGISQRKLMDEDSIVLVCTYLFISPRKAIGSIWSHYFPTGEKKERLQSILSLHD